MGAFKWIAGFLGWVTMGPIGALLGFFTGSAIESGLEAMKQITNGQAGGTQAGSGTAGGYYRRTASTQEQRNSFLVSLLVLSSAVVKADGRLAPSESDYIRDFVRRNFGENAVDEAMRMLGELQYKQVDIYSVGAQIAQNMNYSQRLQLFHYLVGLAQADGSVCQAELSVLRTISGSIGITNSDTDSILAMFEESRESAYTILEIDPSASDEEVKKAYKRMAMKYHPDKVASLGADVQKAAEEKFKKIQSAYETIKRERNMS